jgi:para-aminobenzoate synthetase component 1
MHQFYKQIDLQTKALIPKLNWLIEQESIGCLYYSGNSQHDQYAKHSILAAIGKVAALELAANSLDLFKQLDLFLKENEKSWKFGYLSYDLKNHIEKLHSKNSDLIGFHDAYFFIPKYLFISEKQTIRMLYHASVSKEEVAQIWLRINTSTEEVEFSELPKIEFNKRITREEYLQKIERIRKHIKRGDIYEMNYCQEFYAEKALINPYHVFMELIEKSSAPFSAFWKENNRYLISASPERYLQKQNQNIISQPIKGTSKRQADLQADERSKRNLQQSEKERAENIMIVDLVRNDLGRIKGVQEVKVEELCKIYSFPHVHQMISTISAQLDSTVQFSDIIVSSFPMGSMTGAPKVRAMELIEEYETTKRNLFSGSVGYINPNGDFDFNVIIRSLLYNQSNQYLSLSTGGAITYLSQSETEYEESLLKANAILQLFK